MGIRCDFVDVSIDSKQITSVLELEGQAHAAGTFNAGAGMLMNMSDYASVLEYPSVQTIIV